jgi:hypothetical protein
MQMHRRVISVRPDPSRLASSFTWGFKISTFVYITMEVLSCGYHIVYRYIDFCTV